MNKIDIINSAYSIIRISGLTSNPSSEDVVLALDRLESMAHEFKGRNIDVGYNFEDLPDPNSPHNIPREYTYPIATNLAVRLMADFGKPVDQTLIMQQRQGYSFLAASTAKIRETQYPSRMPIGSGNDLRYNRYQRFYRPAGEIPLDADSFTMYVGDIDIKTEHYDQYLLESETISSYMLDVDSGLKVTSDSLTSPDITYTVEAVSGDSLSQIKIQTTTSLGRVLTRVKNFEVIKP